MRKPRRVVKGLVAMTVVALGVLGVYTVVSPETKEAAAQTPGDAASAPTPRLARQPPRSPSCRADAARGRTRAAAARCACPVTVLNATEINGLAAKVAATIGAGGWETPGVGAYTADDVAATTVFFTEGDETQRQAALQLVDAVPAAAGPGAAVLRAAGRTSRRPGLVVVAAGDWQP